MIKLVMLISAFCNLTGTCSQEKFEARENVLILDDFLISSTDEREVSCVSYNNLAAALWTHAYPFEDEILWMLSDGKHVFISRIQDENNRQIIEKRTVASGELVASKDLGVMQVFWDWKQGSIVRGHLVLKQINLRKTKLEFLNLDLEIESSLEFDGLCKTASGPNSTVLVHNGITIWTLDQEFDVESRIESPMRFFSCMPERNGEGALLITQSDGAFRYSNQNLERACHGKYVGRTESGFVFQRDQQISSIDSSGKRLTETTTIPDSLELVSIVDKSSCFVKDANQNLWLLEDGKQIKVPVRISGGGEISGVELVCNKRFVCIVERIEIDSISNSYSVYMSRIEPERQERSLNVPSASSPKSD